MSSTNPSLHQNAVPSLRELLPGMIGYPLGFVLGFGGFIIGTNRYFLAPHISRGVWWIGLIVCVVFGGFILRSFKTWRLANELDDKGLITRGIITKLWTEDNQAHVIYSFDPKMKDGENQQLSVKQSVSSSLYKELQIGAKVRVRFLPNKPIEPTISRMETPRWKYECY